MFARTSSVTRTVIGGPSPVSSRRRSSAKWTARIGFIAEGANVVFLGPNGVGKTMLLRELADRALNAGHHVVVRTASDRLVDLIEQESSVARARRLAAYAGAHLLCIDEVGHLSYDARHADVLFEVDLFSIAELREHEAALEDEWVEAGKFGRGETYVFGRSDSDSVAVAFLRRHRGADGELPVILLDARGIVERYASLADYLRARRAWFVAALAAS